MFSANFNSYTPGGGGTYKYGSVSIANSEFVVGKSEYTLTMHITANQGSQDIILKCNTVNNGIPALTLGTDAGRLVMFARWESIEASILFQAWSSNTRVLTLTSSGDNILINHNTSGVWGYTNSSYEDDTLNISINADFPIFSEGYTEEYSDPFDRRATNIGFKNLSVNYLPEIANGDYTNIDKACNYFDITNTIPSNKVYSIQNYFKANGSIIESKGYDFRILPDSKIYFVLTNQIEGDASPNMILHITNYPCLVKPYHAPDSAYTESISVDNTYWWGDWQDSDAGITYIGYGSTNIPIFDSEEKGTAYANGDIGEDASINGGSTSIRTSTIGDYLEGTDIPTVNLSTSGVGTYIYALSETQIKDLMSNYLYVTDPTLLDSLNDALWLWGNNPIDFFIDCYYIPFDITNFYTTHNADMKFGTYRFDSTQGFSTFPVVQETNGQRLTLFNTTFEGIYGDWRDYSQFEYDLFLPFYGFFKLDLYKYLNHTVRCEMMFDVTTHNLRYYLFVDDVITDRIDSSVGINLPLMSSDMVNKAKSDRQARRESDRTAYRAMGAFLTGGLAVAGGISSGNASYAVNGGTSAITSVIDAKYNLDALADKVHENATQHVEGAYSSSMNIYDIRYAYLRITESELVIPDKLNELYGYPSYYMGSASALSGYCEISDIRIKSFTGTIEELNALKGALREGVIL